MRDTQIDCFTGGYQLYKDGVEEEKRLPCKAPQPGLRRHQNFFHFVGFSLVN